MEMLIIKRGSPEFNFMWNWIATHPLNKDLAEPMVALNEGETWQYMGSYRNNGKTLHSYRHRNHPSKGISINLTFAASDKINDEDIEQSYTMK